MSLRGADVIVVNSFGIDGFFHHLIEKFGQRPLLIALFNTNVITPWTSRRMAYHLTEVTELRWRVMYYDLNYMSHEFHRFDPNKYEKFDSLIEFRKFLEVERIMNV